jgi:hypothetical protein
MTTNVYYQHNSVKSTVVVTEEGLFHENEVPQDLSGGVELTVEVVHEVQLTDRSGNILILHFDVPKAQDATRVETSYANKVRSFSDTSDNEMPPGLYTTSIKGKGDLTRSTLQLPAGAE